MGWPLVAGLACFGAAMSLCELVVADGSGSGGGGASSCLWFRLWRVHQEDPPVRSVEYLVTRACIDGSELFSMAEGHGGALRSSSGGGPLAAITALAYGTA